MIFLPKYVGFCGILFIFIAVNPFVGIEGYSQVITNGQGDANDQPKIFKALNLDLIYPRSFNSTENPITSTQAYSTESAAPQRENKEEPYASPANIAIYVTPPSNVPQTENAPPETKAAQTEHQEAEGDDSDGPLEQFTSTGRAVDNRPSAYNLNYLMKPLRPQRPRPQTTSNIAKIIYPQSYQRHRGPVPAISDRFTPGEAVASSAFGKHTTNHHQHHHDVKQPSATDIVSSYVPPKDLYSFPPNLDAKYPAPAKDPKAALPSGQVSSYLASPSGPLSNAAGYPLASSSHQNAYKYPIPVSSGEYLPPPSDNGDSAEAPMKDGPPPPDDGPGGNDDTIGVLPASAMDGAADDGKSSEGDPHDHPDHDHHHDAHEHDHEHDHDHPLTGYDDSKEYPTPPPGWVDDHPETVEHHPHAPSDDHHAPYISSFPQFSHDAPDLIYDDHHPYDDHHQYDDHHHFHDFHHDPPPPPPSTTEAPPPEPPPEPRVKKYSYFYIGRKLWYIPLYFTVWFSFYVLWLIVKSIARHKVNLPNHYVSRRSLSDAMNDFNPTSKEHINQLTVKVLQMIDEYRDKAHTN